MRRHSRTIPGGSNPPVLGQEKLRRFGVEPVIQDFSTSKWYWLYVKPSQGKRATGRDLYIIWDDGRIIKLLPYEGNIKIAKIDDQWKQFRWKRN